MHLVAELLAQSGQVWHIAFAVVAQRKIVAHVQVRKSQVALQLADEFFRFHRGHILVERMRHHQVHAHPTEDLGFLFRHCQVEGFARPAQHHHGVRIEG